MKTMIVLALATVAFTACGDRKDTDTTTVTSDTVNTFNADTGSRMTTTSDNTVTYAPSEGDVSYRDGKLMVWRNNEYVVADKDVTLDDGIIVKRNGEVTRNGKVVRMEEGENLSRTGRFFDRTGQAIEDGWDATKRGVKKAANKVKDAVDGDNN
jgi:hypothetical protein